LRLGGLVPNIVQEAQNEAAVLGHPLMADWRQRAVTPDVSSAPHRRPLRGMVKRLRRWACATRHRLSVFLLSHERRHPMAATRTPGIRLGRDGRFFIDKRYRGIRIGMRVGAVTQEQIEGRPGPGPSRPAPRRPARTHERFAHPIHRRDQAALQGKGTAPLTGGFMRA